MDERWTRTVLESEPLQRFHALFAEERVNLAGGHTLSCGTAQKYRIFRLYAWVGVLFESCIY